MFVHIPKNLFSVLAVAVFCLILSRPILGSVRVVHNNDDIGPMLQRCYPGSRKGHD